MGARIRHTATIIDFMLKIGHLEFDFPVVQAALAGYSDAPMRLIAREFGCPYALHYVVLDKSVALSAKARESLLGPLEPADRPLGAQLMGAEPAQFASAAVILYERGFNVVDINFGCPVKKVLGRCRGGYLLSDPPTAIAILRAVRQALPSGYPVTLKMRRAMDDEPESEANFFRIFDAACELGIAAITVHGRTVQQRYTGIADWDFLARLRQHAPEQTLLGSGDLWCAEDIRDMFARTGVDGVSVARGCIGNPWIFSDAEALLAGRPLPEPPSVAEQGEVIRRQFELSLRLRGEKLAGRLMRKVGIKFAELHPHAGKVRKAFVGAMNEEQWRAVLDEWYDPHRDWPPGVRKQRPSDLIAAGAK